ncbi:response regulator [Acanthopleuribacter pedis]|uniref:Response regulator n=1 Tax=Acanthopleuribacter pedis TaxID=442870 RepID=A0A8J7QE17_9BACT|nr:response regulator [Acanthopleuribacter pedis]
MSALRNILCIEDDPDIQMVLNLALTELGDLTVAFCNTAKAALETLAKTHPDLILMDLRLPDSDGHDLFHKIQAMTESNPVPVVVITAARASRLSEEIAGLIHKPFDPMILAEQLETFFHAFHKAR